MKNIIFYLMIIFTFLISGCSSSFKITKTFDTGNHNISVYKSSAIQIKGNSRTDTYEAFLRYFAYKNKNKRTYEFDVFYRGRQWGIFSSIKLDIDGVKSEFKVKSQPIRKQDNLQGLTEELVVTIPNDKIEELIENRKCKMTIVGQNLSIKVDFKQEWFDKLINFYSAVNKKS